MSDEVNDIRTLIDEAEKTRALAMDAVYQRDQAWSKFYARVKQLQAYFNKDSAVVVDPHAACEDPGFIQCDGYEYRPYNATLLSRMVVHSGATCTVKIEEAEREVAAAIGRLVGEADAKKEVR